MAKEIRLAHDRGHQEQMREIINLAGERGGDVHWYPRPGGHAHGGIVLAPDDVADAWAAQQQERSRAEREPDEETPAEPDEETEPEAVETEPVADETPADEGAEGAAGPAEPEDAPTATDKPRRGRGRQSGAEGDGSAV